MKRHLLWVDTSKQLSKVVDEAKKHKAVALDAEMDSYYSYKTKLCLVQMSYGDTDALVDPLALSDLSSLNEITEDESITKVFHAGENDVPYFREHGVTFNSIFDTHIAAKVLELPTKSYGGLVELYFDFVLPKDQSRADWRLRPLPQDQVAYARQDTIHLIELFDILRKELDGGGVLHEAEHMFRALEPRVLREKTFDPDGWAKIKGAKELSGVQRSIIKEVFAWREEQAQRADLAAFRVMQNWALLNLARRTFSSPEQLRSWAKSDFLKKDVQRVFQLIEKGKDIGAIPYPERRRRGQDEWSDSQQKVFDRLCQWRNEESERRSVDPSRIFSNRQLKNMMLLNPKNVKSLATVEGVEAGKLEQYGDTILALMRQ